MKQFFENLPDGWTIYVWMIVAALFLVTAIFGLRWAAKNEQFDEDIKYVVFDEDDKDRMSPEEFAKMKEVNVEQERQREEYLKHKAEQRAAKQDAHR